MPTTKRNIAGLDCRIYDELSEGESPQALVILCHGFGAPGHDLASLGRQVLALRPELSRAARFVFPAGRLSLESAGIPGGRAWWLLDIEKMSLAIQRGEFRNVRNDHPPELPVAREQIVELINTLTGEAGLPMSQVILGGFSQGSMLATDVALRLPELVGDLVILSGSLLSEDEWRELAAQRGPLNVLQSHGHEDPILPFEAAVWLRDLLTESGMNVEFVPFHGMHSIPESVVGRLADRVAQRCASDS